MPVVRSTAKIGVGDSLSTYNQWAEQKWSVEHGTAASPVTTAGPTVKMSRTEDMDAATANGNAVDDEATATLSVYHKALAGSEMQSCAIRASAENLGTSAAGDDAFALSAHGRITGSGTGIGSGAYIEGRRDTATAMVNGMEVTSWNYTADDPTYSTSAISETCGIWVASRGLTGADNAAGIQLGAVSGSQWKVGLGFVAGSLVTNAIRDDSDATTSVLIKGTHSTAALAVGAGAGKVIVGAEAQMVASALLEVAGPASATDPLVQFGSSANANGYSVRLRNSTASSIWFVAGGANDFVTGSAAGDGGFSLTSGRKFIVGQGSGAGIITAFNNAGTNQLGFFSATTIAKPSGWGAPTGTPTRTTFATGSVTLPVLAEHVKALIDDLTSYGLIGA